MRVKTNIKYKRIMKYIGVKRNRVNGKKFFAVNFMHEGVVHSFGNYEDDKAAAKDYDLYVIKNRIPRETNFLKKKID
jgi:hypothetical protein